MSIDQERYLQQLRRLVWCLRFHGHTFGKKTNTSEIHYHEAMAISMRLVEGFMKLMDESDQPKGPEYVFIPRAQFKGEWIRDWKKKNPGCKESGRLYKRTIKEMCEEWRRRTGEILTPQDFRQAVKRYKVFATGVHPSVTRKRTKK